MLQHTNLNFLVMQEGILQNLILHNKNTQQFRNTGTLPQHDEGYQWEKKLSLTAYSMVKDWKFPT